MKDQSKTKQVLIQELSLLRQKIAELEQSESERKRVEELRETKEHLEIRVKERTAELDQVNRALQAEIAERKQAEEAVKRERQRLDNVLETLPAYVVLLSADYYVPFANRFFRERFGESEGRRCYEYLFHRSSPCEICETYTVLKTAAPHRWEWAGPDGRNYDIFDFPFTDVDGAPLILEVGIDITERKQAKEALQQTLNELEQRVADRTEELMRVNEELRADITERKRAEEALIASEEHYRSVVENASDVVFRTDGIGNFTYVNPEGLRVTGYEEEELIGKHYPAFIRPDMREEAIKFFGRQFVKGIKNTYTEYPVITKKGHELWFGQNTQLIVEDGRLTGFQAVSRDITDRKRMGKELNESEKKYRTMLENIQDGYYEVDLLGNLTFVNPSLSRILGYSQEELIGMNNRQYMDDENAKKVFRAFYMVYKTEAPTSHFDWELIKKDKKKAFVGCSVSLIKDSFDKPVGFRGIVRDITDKKKAEAALHESENRYRELSIIDDLTQLYNSRYFYHQLKMEIDRVNRYGEQPTTLLLLDLDDFKKFNDAYGHVEGDQVLSRLGQVVKRCLRQTDSAYRYGGEEFTVLLPMTTSKDAAVTAERIRTEFKKENFSPAPGKDVHMTVSIGLAQYKSQEDIKAFVHRVDQLMYQAKKNGKDRVCSAS